MTAGEPSEFSFTLSKTSRLPVGKVRFKVTNRGVIGHSFKVCAQAVTAATANSCVGVSTKVLARGKTAILIVTFKRKGKYEFLCAVPGHAANGMKGLIGAGVTVTQAEATATTTTTATPTPGTVVKPGPPTTAAGSGACAVPGTASVTVTMSNYSFTGMPASLPCGVITINEVNAGQQNYNISFSGPGVTNGVGPVIGPGTSASFTMTINPGVYSYQCDVGDDASRGMVGSISVY